MVETAAKVKQRRKAAELYRESDAEVDEDSTWTKWTVYSPVHGYISYQVTFSREENQWAFMSNDEMENRRLITAEESFMIKVLGEPMAMTDFKRGYALELAYEKEQNGC